jgi:hypothetical protein
VQGGAGGITPHTQSAPAPAAAPRERYPVPTVQEAGWVSGPVWMGPGNIAPPPLGFEPPTVQPVASRHADRVRTGSLNTTLKGNFLVFHVLLAPVSHVV